MTSRTLHRIWKLTQWIMAATIVYVVADVWYHRGIITGEAGCGYWQGWQDAMTATDYGKKPYNSESRQ